jgi:ATP-dependent DNA ligase
VLDGEIVVPGEQGVSNFSAVQADLAAGRIDLSDFMLSTCCIWTAWTCAR